MATATLRTIFINERGVASIAGTSITVKEIVIEKTVWGMTPEEMLAAHPQWSLPQIYAALSYYYDHQAEIDAQIEEDRAWAVAAREAYPNRLTRDDFLRRLQPS